VHIRERARQSSTIKGMNITTDSTTRACRHSTETARIPICKLMHVVHVSQERALTKSQKEKKATPYLQNDNNNSPYHNYNTITQW
jgi:hypothetical protein